MENTSSELVDAASSLFQQPSIFEEDWKQFGGESPLAAVAEFNAGFGGETHTFVDPQLMSRSPTPDSTLSALSPHRSCGLLDENDLVYTGHQDCVNLFDGGEITTEARRSRESEPAFSSFHQNVMPVEEDPWGDDPTYPAPAITDHTPAAPYFHHSVEHLHNEVPQQPYKPSPLRQEVHHRSVSEPPCGPPPSFDLGATQHYHYQLPQPMVFHRQGQYLGKPLVDGSIRASKRPSGRALSRYQPYAKDHRLVREAAGKGRDGSKRQQSAGPTSTPCSPMEMVPPFRRLPISGPQEVLAPIAPSPVRYVSSRVCTPSPERMGSAPPGSVACMTMDGMQSVKRATLSIDVTIEQLQGMITEAVETAINGLGKENIVLSAAEKEAADSETVIVGGANRADGGIE